MLTHRYTSLLILLTWLSVLGLTVAPRVPFVVAQAANTPRPTVVLPTITPDQTPTPRITPTATRTPQSTVAAANMRIAADASLLRFNPLTVTVPANQAISLTFVNPASIPHNWVLVPAGQEAAVNNLALNQNGDARDLPGVIAATPLITGTQSALTLPPLPAGRYIYLCTVPGHFLAGMWGVLVVTGGTPAPTRRPPLALPTATPAASSPTTLTLALEEVGSDLARPVFVTHAGDGSERLFVVEKAGTIRTLPDNELFLDITDRVGSGASEQGLLGLAFHPSFAANGFLYVNYTDKQGDTVIARFALATDGISGDPESEQVLLTVDQPASNHNGGMVAFGGDGYLYLGLGDGGGSRDRYENAQDLTSLLGKILRIDVDNGDPYAIPADNPFVADASARPEIWAYGLRNPWRFSFDRGSGDLYVGDVGQNRFESLLYQPVVSPGGENYGWPILEGQSCLNGDDCDRTGLTEAVYSYPHSEGCSVTGGYVYRGTQFPALQGRYLFGDYCSGRIWVMEQDAADAWTVSELLDSDASISSFGEDEAGELYVTDYSDGVVYQVVVQ